MSVLNLTLLLTTQTGGLVYHLLTLFAIEAGLAVAWDHWRRTGSQQPRRLMVAFGGLLTVRLGFIALYLLHDWSGWRLFLALRPPLVSTLETAAIVLLVWAFVLPALNDRRLARAFIISQGGMTALVALLFIPIWYLVFTSRPDLDYAATWQGALWETWRAILLVGAVGVMVWKQREEWVPLLVAFGALLVGRILLLFFPVVGLSPSSYSALGGLDRLGNLIAYPLMAVVTYKLSAADVWVIHRNLKSYQGRLEAMREQARQHSQELLYMLEASRVTNASLELEKVLSKMIESIALAVRTDFAVIAVMEDPDSGTMRITTGYDPLAREIWEISQVRFTLDRYPHIHEAFRTQHPLILQSEEPSSHLVAMHALMGSVEVGPVLVQPLVHKDEGLGVIMLSNAQSQRPFSPEDTHLSQALAGQVSGAIANARLYESVVNLLYQRQAEASQQQAILESIADGVVVSDHRGRVIMVNAAAEKILGASREALRNRRLRDVCTHLEAAPQAIFELNEHTVMAHAAPVRMANGKLLGLVAVLRDITKEQEAERAKSRFIETVSHELRTPMTAIKGYTELLLGNIAGNGLDRKYLEFLGTIHINTERMVGIVNNMIAISEMEGGLDLSWQPVEIPDVIQRAVRNIRPQLTARKHELILDVPDGLPSIEGDGPRLRQVLDNLLSNACKYTPAGGRVTVQAKTHSAPNTNDKYLHVSVSDNGVGIPPEEQERIFERFYRADNPLQIEAGGPGVGLAIAKYLVELHGGRIWVESQVDSGSTFHVLLPLKQGALNESERAFSLSGEG
jgi:signal transduction histidine kinase